jgi:hypothetical protein
VVYLMSKDKLQVKTLFKRKQVHNEESSILCFNILYLKTQEEFLCFVLLFNV